MTRVQKIVAAIAAVVVTGAVGVAVLWEWQTADTVKLDSTDQQQLAMGARVYLQNCASCHGANLEGQSNWRKRKVNGRLRAPPHDETGNTWHHPDEQLFRLTKHGMKPPLAPVGYESDMPAFADILTDNETLAVLSFIKSTWPLKERAIQERIDKAHRSQAKKQ